MSPFLLLFCVVHCLRADISLSLEIQPVNRVIPVIFRTHSVNACAANLFLVLNLVVVYRAVALVCKAMSAQHEAPVPVMCVCPEVSVQSPAGRCALLVKLV